MENKFKATYQTVLDNWEMMLHSGIDDAEEDAERFETSFHTFIDELSKWIHSHAIKPTTLVKVHELSEIKEIMESIPTPLQINFETELDLIVEEINKSIK